MTITKIFNIPRRTSIVWKCTQWARKVRESCNSAINWTLARQTAAPSNRSYSRLTTSTLIVFTSQQWTPCWSKWFVAAICRSLFSHSIHQPATASKVAQAMEKLSMEREIVTLLRALSGGNESESNVSFMFQVTSRMFHTWTFRAPRFEGENERNARKTTTESGASMGNARGPSSVLESWEERHSISGIWENSVCAMKISRLAVSVRSRVSPSSRDASWLFYFAFGVNGLEIRYSE